VLLLDVSIHPWLWLCYEPHVCAAKAVQNPAFIKYVCYALDPFQIGSFEALGVEMSPFTCDDLIGASGRAALQKERLADGRVSVSSA
jgi:hypothetical protein